MTGPTGAAPSADGAKDVLVTWPDYPDDSSLEAARLREVGLTIRRAPRLGERTEAEVIELVRGCVAAIVSTDPFTRAVFESAPTLRLVSRVGVGVDSVDVGAATEHGIGVTSARGTNEAAVADHTVALMLAVLRRIPELDAKVREGAWLRTGRWAGTDLHGKTVGMLGLGRIARLVVRRLSGFGVDIVGYDPVAETPGWVRPASLTEVVSQADVLSLHLPLTPETRNLVGSEMIARMKPGAILVNTARGGILDEQALADAIESGHVRGAALDVFAEEPPLASRLLGLNGATVLTPHVGGLSTESIADMVGHATDAVVAAMTGREPHDLVNQPAHALWRLTEAPALDSQGRSTEEERSTS